MAKSKSAITMDCLALGNSLTIENVSDTASRFNEQDAGKAQDASNSTYYVNAEKTEAITTPGIQLLLSLAKTLEQRGDKLSIIGSHENLIHAFHTLGLEARITEWSNNNG